MSLINIDSEFRNKTPKNITQVNRNYLSNNPITLKKGSNELKFYQPNHQFKTGDTVTIHNVESYSKTLSNSLYFIDGFEYFMVKFPNHNIDRNYTNYNNTLQVESIIQTKIDSSYEKSTRFYGNIPINMTTGLLQIFTFDNLENSNKITDVQIKLLIDNFKDIGTKDDIYSNFIFIKIEFPFNISYLDQDNISNQNNIIGTSIYNIPYVYKISFMDLEGIPLFNINSDYPITYQRQQGNLEIDSIESDYFYIKTKKMSYSNGSFGGSKITISKILKSISGYPNASEFTIELKKNFTNVSRIELVSSEVPFVEYTILEGKNNKIYWQNLDDGDAIYNVSISPGNYSASSLVSEVQNEMNLVERVNSTDEDIIYNLFEITANTFTSDVQFKPFTNNNLPNSVTDDRVEIDLKTYYRLTIKHPNNFVEPRDKIEISGCSAIGVIPKGNINTEHIVYEVDKDKQTYSVILPPFNESANPIDPPGNGGLGIKIKTPTKCRLLFNYPDSMGEIFGFKRVGEENSITKYSSVISNLDPYAYELNVDTVGNYNNYSNLFLIDGTTTYWLLYLNDFESVILSGTENCFAKILITAVQGEMCFNSFVNNPVDIEVPIASLSELNVRLTDKYGNNINLLNNNFSFTLRIYELISNPKETMLTNTNYYDELLKDIGKKELKKSED